MKNIKLRMISHSPGYSDMSGGFHYTVLKKDGDGDWTYVCSNRDFHNEPTVTATFEVSADAVCRLEAFIKSKVLPLKYRPKSNIFATDYSPWSWSIDYETTFFGKSKLKSCRLDEYKRYCRRDQKILRELEKRFASLCGKKLSVTVDDN